MCESAPLARAGFRVAYAAPGAAADLRADFAPRAAWLGGATEESLFASAAPVGRAGALRLFEHEGLLIGCGRVPVVAGLLARVAGELYHDVLAAVGERHLYRVWHYVPQINAEIDGLENYRAFCQGRSLAFERRFGPGFERQLCAASAVGSEGDALEVLFVAGGVAPTHLENPEQIPAYAYPPEHGPRPPSFARATLVSTRTRTYVFVSGTSSIKGHRTVEGTLEQQLACTADNLRLVARACHAADAWAGERHFKVYLRHPGTVDAARAWLERSVLRPGDRVTYLHADICRAALDVEIEATLVS